MKPVIIKSITAAGRLLKLIRFKQGDEGDGVPPGFKLSQLSYSVHYCYEFSVHENNQKHVYCAVDKAISYYLITKHVFANLSSNFS